MVASCAGARGPTASPRPARAAGLGARPALREGTRLVASSPAAVVDGRPVRVRLVLLPRGRRGGTVGADSAARDRRRLLRRIDLLHERRLPPVRGGRQRRADRGAAARGAEARWRPLSWEPRRIDWLAALVQFVGTLFFNVTTFTGMKHGFSVHQTNARVWAPDAFGSIAFLISSELAYAEVCHRWLGWKWTLAVVADRGAQHARVDRVRHLCRGVLHRARERRACQRPPGQWGNLARRTVLPRGGAAADARGGCRGARRGRGARPPPRAPRSTRPERATPAPRRRVCESGAKCADGWHGTGSRS